MMSSPVEASTSEDVGRRTRSRSRREQKQLKNLLPSVPKVICGKKLSCLSQLTYSILNSATFYDAMNDAASYLDESFDEQRIPNVVYVATSKELDERETPLFGLYDPEFVYKGDASKICIQLSHNLAEYIWKNPSQHQMILFGSVIVVHEVAHALLRSGLGDLNETPPEFKMDHNVDDFGMYVERKLFLYLELGYWGIQLLSTEKGWINVQGSYGTSDLGTTEQRKKNKLKNNYIEEIVRRGIWRPPHKDDIDYKANFSGKTVVRGRGTQTDEDDYECSVKCGVNELRHGR
jgi:hypothetical protein